MKKFRNDTTQLSALISMLAPLSYNDQISEQLIGICKDLGRQINVLVCSCQENTDFQDFSSLLVSADNMHFALAALMNSIKDAPSQKEDGAQLRSLIDNILNGMNEISIEGLELDVLKSKSKDLTLNLGKLLACMKNEINEAKDENTKNDLFSAAKLLADSTKLLLENTKALQNEELDQTKFMKFQSGIKSDLYDFIKKNYQEEFQQIQLILLKNCLNRVISTSIIMESSMRNASESCRSEVLAKSLNDESENLHSSRNPVIEALGKLEQTPDSLYYQYDLIEKAKFLCDNSKKVLTLSRNAIPLIADFDHSALLNKSTRNLVGPIEDLEKLLSQTEEADPSTRIEVAKERMDHISNDLDILSQRFNQGKVKQLPEKEKENFDNRLMETYREMMKIQAQLSHPSTFEDSAQFCPILEKLSFVVSKVISPAYGVAACSSKPEDKKNFQALLQNLQNILTSSINCCTETKNMILCNSIPQSLLDSIKRNSDAILSLLSTIPTNQDIEKAAKSIQLLSDDYKSQKPAPPILPGKTYIDVKNEIAENISFILETVAELLRVVSREEIQKFPSTFTEFASRYAQLYRNIKSLASNHPDKQIAKIINDGLGSMVEMSVRLASTSKLYAADPNSSTKLFITETAKSFSDSLSNLLLTLLSSKSGRRECENYKNLMKLTYSPMLESSNCEIFTRKPYNVCIQEIEKMYANKFKQIEHNLIKSTENENSMLNIGKNIEDWEDLLTEILKNTSHASYMLGVSDTTSTAEYATIFDEKKIKSLQNEIIATFEAIEYKEGVIRDTDIDLFKKDSFKAVSNLVFYCKEAISSLTGNASLQKNIMDGVDAITATAKNSLINLDSANKPLNDQGVKDTVKKSKKLIKDDISRLLKIFETPEMRCIPWHIGEHGRLMQEPLISDGQNVITTTVDALEDICKLIHDFDDHNKKEILLKISKNKIAIETLISTLKSQAPGDNIFGDIISRLEDNESDIKKVSEQVRSETINRRANASKEYELQFEMNNTQIMNILKEIIPLSENESHLVAARLETVADLMEGMLNVIDGLSSTFNNIDKNSELKMFEQLSALNLAIMHCANSFRSNPQPIKDQKPLSIKSAVEMSINEGKNLSDIVKTLSQKSSVLQVLIQKIQKINATLKVEGFKDSKEKAIMDQKDYENKIIAKLKNIVIISQDINRKASTKQELIEPLCKDLFEEHEKCANLVFDNTYSLSDMIKTEARKLYIELGENIKNYTELASRLQSEPDSKKELSQNSIKISTCVSNFLKLLQSSHKGEEACAKLAEYLSDALIDIDTCILFAQNDSLENEPDKPNMNTLKTPILKTSEEIVGLVDELMQQKQYSDINMLKFANRLDGSLKVFVENNKNAAISLGSKDSLNQLSLLNATKNIGGSIFDLLESLKLSQTGEAAKQNKMVEQNVEKTKTFLEKHNILLEEIDQRTTNASAALSKTSDHIQSMIPYMDKSKTCPWDNDLSNLAPEDLVRISKDIPLSCAKIVQAVQASKPKDIEEFTTKGDTAFEHLIKGARRYVLALESPNVTSLVTSLKKCADCYVEMLKNVENNKTQSDKKTLSGISKKVTEAVVIFIKKCTDLKGKNLKCLIGENFFDSDDPSAVAERELLNAAAAIELAAKKLSELKPRVIQTDQPERELNFEGQILEAANSIMKATALLVTAATAAQKELVKAGAFKVNAEGKQDSGQWSQGLISAARLVAESTNMLCDAAKAAVEGKASEEKLIAACNSISGSTTQLIMACKVKADPNSENQARLEKAGFAVKKASKTFVESLKGSGIFAEEKQENINVQTSKVGGLKQEIDAMEEIAKREKELMEARGKLFKLRQAKAQPKND
ncbi:hypothetical protein HZS_2150 [Henneguya salminicola]|nr:hypothetical protein HZS_2150 [Henneguya salminicola]